MVGCLSLYYTRVSKAVEVTVLASLSIRLVDSSEKSSILIQFSVGYHNVSALHLNLVIVPGSVTTLFFLTVTSEKISNNVRFFMTVRCIIDVWASELVLV